MDNAHVTALVTGASRGIGYSIAQKLLESGATVIGTARSSKFPGDLVEQERFEGIYVDLASLDDVRKQIKPLFDRKRAPNVLINNAGISEDAPFSSSDSEWMQNWNRTIAVNLTAPSLISKWAINRWVEEGDGILINVSSRAAYRGDTEQFASYAASKGGLVSFTKSVARDFGRQGIAAYSIAPGFIDTDMASEVKEVYGEEYLTRDLSFDEVTPPGQVGEMVAFLATGKVKHMTGATFHINGGSYMI